MTLAEFRIAIAIAEAICLIVYLMNIKYENIRFYINGIIHGLFIAMMISLLMGG